MDNESGSQDGRLGRHEVIEAESESSGTLYDLLTGLVTPRPIAIVSTLSENGSPNLAPFSFFMLGGTAPPSLCISSGRSEHGEKDTLRNIRSQGEFTVCLVDGEMAQGMAASGASLPDEPDDWKASGFQPAHCDKVKPAFIASCPAAFECRLFQVVEHGSEAGSARYVIGEIVQIHIRKDLILDGRLRPERIGMLSRVAGRNYLDMADLRLFTLDS